MLRTTVECDDVGMRRSPWLLIVPLASFGCFNPPDPSGSITATDGDETESDAGGTTDGPSTMTATGSGTSPTASETNPTDPTDPTTTDPSETEGDAVCGDGEVNGDEVCDDGVNDGSYGGCLDDCSGLAAHCGDGEVNGDEVCDDGVNDGSYDGCADGCAELGPYCGDGETNGDEGCDNGELNENASGCNIDCVISGSVVEDHEIPGVTFCDGDFVTQPLFRDNGNVLVSATGYCNDDTVILLELDTELEEVEDYADTVLLPGTPVREATLLGDDWLLASSGCNYLIDDTGSMSEVCEDRIQGVNGIDAIDDSSYVASDYDGLAGFGAGSPSVGDSPTWNVAPPDNASYDYGFYRSNLGPASSSYVVGFRRLISNSTYSGYVAQYTAGGNLADSRVDGTYQSFTGVVYSEADDTVLVWNEYPDYTLVKYNSSLNDVWSIPVPTNNEIDVAVDSTGDIVLLFRDDTAMSTILTKRSPDAATERWATPLDPASYTFRVGIADDDYIYVAGVDYSGGAMFYVRKVAP